MKTSLLIEIGVEELPASYIQPAMEQFGEGMAQVLTSNQISFREVRKLSTPRRLALLFESIDGKGKTVVQRVYGPPEEQAFDENSEATKAAEGFARSMGKAVSDIKIGEKKGKRVCYLEKKQKPKQTSAVVGTSLAGVLSDIYFPKRMRWESSGFSFARPIRWVVVLLGKKAIRTSVAGISSSRYSYGPRFTGDLRIKIEDASDYDKVMERNHVIVSFERRREKIRKEAKKLLESSTMISDDRALLDEVTNLVEFPTVFKGSFDASFLEMPKDVLVTAMKEHQRYFAVLNSSGKIQRSYIGIANGTREHIERITKGHNSVLRARLSDARFYWDEDLKIPFSERIEDLKGVEWHRGLGTVYNKSMRLVALSRSLSTEVGKGRMDIIERGALLAKVDLVTNMIKDGKEFTTLEGIIGKEYALRSKEKKDAAEIIAQHHLPRNPDDNLPALLEASIVGIADRVDTLVGNFMIGEIPSGSYDPFGLRRCAYGLLRIIDSFSMRFSLRDLINKNIDLFLGQKGISCKLGKEDVVSRLLEFVEGRMGTYLSNLGVRYDIGSSVTAVAYDDLFDVISKIRCLNDERKDAYFEALVIGQRRVSNILKGTEHEQQEVDVSLFESDAETALWSEFAKIKESFAKAMETHNYKKALRELFSLRPFIDGFFDECMVMDKNEMKKLNRLSMLVRIRGLFNEYADFSLIVLEEERDEGRESQV